MGKRLQGVATSGLAAVLTATLAGCGLLPGSGAATAPTVAGTTTPTPSELQPSSPAVTPSVSETPSEAPSTVAPVKATGTMSFHAGNVVTKKFTGTCAVVDGKPTVKLADHNNDFYGTVDVTIVLTDDGGDVVSITGDLGEDSELITRKLVHPAKGTTASLGESGGDLTVSGNGMLYEDGAKTGTLVPYRIAATCASSTWMS